MFKQIKSFSAIKAPDKEGCIEGCIDMLEQSMYPITNLFKYKKEYMVIIVEYKKIEKCQIN